MENTRPLDFDDQPNTMENPQIYEAEHEQHAQRSYAGLFEPVVLQKDVKVVEWVGEFSLEHCEDCLAGVVAAEVRRWLREENAEDVDYAGYVVRVEPEFELCFADYGEESV